MATALELHLTSSTRLGTYTPREWLTAPYATFIGYKPKFTPVDYGGDIAGKPVFQVASLESNAQMEVKYSESFRCGYRFIKRHLNTNKNLHFSVLLHPQSDGPFAFANALSATFRAETFNITFIGNFTGYFIQGSRRWQSIRPVGGRGITIANVGFVSSVDQAPVSFSSLVLICLQIYVCRRRLRQCKGTMPRVTLHTQIFGLWGLVHSNWDVMHRGLSLPPRTSRRTVSISGARNLQPPYTPQI